jgi:hypothetical protein
MSIQSKNTTKEHTKLNQNLLKLNFQNIAIAYVALID